jgi:quercetin dioxygenase-like cupin family protein
MFRESVPLVPRLAASIAFGAEPIRDPAQVYPDHKVPLDNDCVRVMDFTLRKGDSEALHPHPAPVRYVLQGFEVEFALGDGSKGLRKTKAGDVLFSNPVTHSPVNIGQTDAHGILTELKNPAAGPKPLS